MQLLLVLLLSLRLCTAHDVFTGTTTLDCARDRHACETSGTVMLSPGESFTMTTHPDHDVKYVSIGYLEAENDEKGVIPALQNIQNVTNFAVNPVQCDLEFFSVVWFCPKLKDIVMARNGTYVLHVPASAQRSQFIAWGQSESPKLVLGLTVQWDAARARHKVGGMLPGVAVGTGSFVTLGALLWASWYYYGQADRNTNLKLKEEKNAWIVNIVALVSHVWYISMPLLRAVSAPNVALVSKVPMLKYYYLDTLSVIFVILFSLGPTVTKPKKGDEKTFGNCTQVFLQFVAFVAVILYPVTGLVHGEQWLWMLTFSVYAVFLIVVSLYFWFNTLEAWHVPRIQQWQCLALMTASLVFLFSKTNRMFFAFSAMQWFLGIMVLQVLAVQVGAITVANRLPAVLGSAVFVSIWAVLFFDVTSYGVAIVMLYVGMLKPVWQYVQAKRST